MALELQDIISAFFNDAQAVWAKDAQTQDTNETTNTITLWNTSTK